MKNKKIRRIIYGSIAIIVIVAAVFISKNKKEDKIEEWKTYKNDELNIETKLPEGVEVEIQK
ncbi:MAG: hypothetical protein V1655_03130 [bacterium]